MKFIVVEDNKTFRDVVVHYLETILSHKVIGVAEDGEEFLKIENPCEADIILMDIDMPNINGIETTKLVKQEYKDNVKIIALSIHDDFIYMKSMLEAGASAYVCKSEIGKHLNIAINKVMNNEIYYPELT